VRQDTQALIKQWWAEIGIETELKNVSAAVFFGGDQSSPDTFQKFYADVEMYTNLFNGTDLEAFLGYWFSGNIPNPDNNWRGLNMPRYVDPVYDQLLADLSSTADITARGDIARAMNDILVQGGIMIPLVNRGTVSARVNSLAGVRLNTWDSEMWNVADWTRN
jgi:peptide/nickel transport system substrate-binding protein